MKRQEKIEAAKTLGENFVKAQSAFLVDYQGCSCSDLTSLRAKLRPTGATFSVVKNTLTKRAISEGDFSGLAEHLVGPTAVVLSEEDPVSPAKLLSDFSKDQESFQIKAGVVDGEIVDSAAVEALAKLPSREELLSTLLALINAPATRLLQTMNAPAAQLARLLGAWKSEIEKKAE